MSAPLRVTLHGMDVVWTARRRFVIPLSHVKGARIDPNVARRGPWLGAGHTDALLDYAVAGRNDAGARPSRFWDVHHPEAQW